MRFSYIWSLKREKHRDAPGAHPNEPIVPMPH